MPHEFKMMHRVEFADTDMAGIIHFASYFRYMEVTEHAFFRSLGFSIIHSEGVSWPRVHVACDYKSPLRFEDEIEVHLRVKEKKARSLTYEFRFHRVRPEPTSDVARGTLTVVCVTMDDITGKMKATPIPERIAAQIETAPTEGQE